MARTIVSTSADGTILWSDGSYSRPNFPQAGQDTFDTVGTFDPLDASPPNPTSILVNNNSLTTGEVIQGAGTSAIIFFSDAMRSIGLSLFVINPGSAVIQYTYDKVETIQNGNDSSINWFNWSKGVVNASTNLWDNCPRAIRLQVTSGKWRLDWKAVKT